MLVAAVLCSAAHATSVALLTPVTYDPAADVPQKVKDECRLDYQLQSEISNAIVRYFKSPNGTTTSTDGQVVRATITYVLGTAGGGWSGPKVVAIRVELLNNGTVERSAKLHGIWPKKGAIRVGSNADLVVLERGDFIFDETTLVDRPEMNWSPYHGRRMRARVAANHFEATGRRRSWCRP